eukprot:1881735-Prymnesium_polylepis.2
MNERRCAPPFLAPAGRTGALGGATRGADSEGRVGVSSMRRMAARTPASHGSGRKFVSLDRRRLAKNLPRGRRNSYFVRRGPQKASCFPRSLSPSHLVLHLSALPSGARRRVPRRPARQRLPQVVVLRAVAAQDEERLVRAARARGRGQPLLLPAEAAHLRSGARVEGRRHGRAREHRSKTGRARARLCVAIREAAARLLPALEQ